MHACTYLWHMNTLMFKQHSQYVLAVVVISFFLCCVPACPLICQNGGTLNTGACTCDCTDGYSGATCESEILLVDVLILSNWIPNGTDGWHLDYPHNGMVFIVLYWYALGAHTCMWYRQWSDTLESCRLYIAAETIDPWQVAQMHPHLSSSFVLLSLQSDLPEWRDSGCSNLYMCLCRWLHWV